MNKEEKFWKWFRDNEEKIFSFDPDDTDSREKLFHELQVRLQKVHRGLTFEFGPPDEKKREFVISADGIKDIFPAVLKLSKRAPDLERWQVIAFRPRRSTIMPVQINERTINPDDLQFTLLDNGRIAGIELFIPGCREDEPVWQQIGYLMLDQALGEFDVESRLGPIKILPPEAPADGTRYSFLNLAKQFDQLVARLESRSTEPS